VRCHVSLRITAYVSNALISLWSTIFDAPIIDFMKSNPCKSKTVNLDDDTLKAIAETRDEIERNNPGMRVSTSDAVRVLVQRACRAGERE
jgi:hypothetical protein